MSDTRDFTLIFDGTGTDTKTLPPGRSFVVLSSSTVMTGSVFRGGQKFASISRINQGDLYRVRPSAEEFDKIELNSAGAQTVIVLVSDGNFETGTLIGSVSVNNTPTIAAVTAALTPPSLVTGYYRKSITSALQTIITPAQNTAGIRVHYCMLGATVTEGRARIMAKTSAPASLDDTTANTLLYAYPNAGCYTAQQSFSILLPAGMGLYEISSNTANDSYCAIDYELL